MGFTFNLSLCGSKGERKVDTNNCANTSRRTTQSSYSWKKLVRTTINITLEPEHIKADFELALMQSLELSFPSASSNGRLYHFAQAIHRKLQSLGLQTEYQTNGSDTCKFFCRVLALPFIVIRYVRMAWAGLKADEPQIQGINDLITYFEHTWLGGQFAPAKWNVYSEKSPRTNNNLEGWHTKVQKVVGKNHLNIFEIIELFKKVNRSRNQAVDGRRDQKETGTTSKK